MRNRWWLATASLGVLVGLFVWLALSEDGSGPDPQALALLDRIEVRVEDRVVHPIESNGPTSMVERRLVHSDDPVRDVVLPGDTVDPSMGRFGPWVRLAETHDGVTSGGCRSAVDVLDLTYPSSDAWLRSLTETEIAELRAGEAVFVELHAFCLTG